MSVIRPQRYTTEVEGHGTWFDLYEGNCAIHGDCIEGLIGANALADRAGMDFSQIPDDHMVWDLFAYYAAQLCITVAGMLSPSHIVLTGRCMKQLENREFSYDLLVKIRRQFYKHLRDQHGNYRPNYPELLDFEDFIRLPRRPRREGESYPKGGLPGRHGALRLAAAEVFNQLESKRK